MDASRQKLHSPLLWDFFCVASLVGIWPRFIEPNLIFTTHLSLPIADLPQDLHRFKILQLSDLHLNRHTSDAFLKKLIRKCQQLKPDLIAFTGDFICYSHLQEAPKLKSLLEQLQAPYGCYAVLGNHDYASFVSINPQGDYDVITPSGSTSLFRALHRLIESNTLTKKITIQAQNTPLHSELISLIQKTPVKLLHNATEIISIGNAKLNICGLGEYSLNKNDASQAFQKYDRNHSGIILLHNPDGVSSLKDYPGDIILSGHTHGGQVNLPWMWKKFTLMENMKFKRGLYHSRHQNLNFDQVRQSPIEALRSERGSPSQIGKGDEEEQLGKVAAGQNSNFDAGCGIRKEGNKWLYINRGLGSVLPFRWFSPPEILLLTLEKKR